MTTTGFELTHRPVPLRRLLRDVWASRDLVRMLARKDFYARYRRASFGLMWALGLPLVQATVLAVVFTRVVKIDTGDVSYGAFVVAGIIPWAFLSSTVGQASTAIAEGQALATKIYFPRAVLPLAAVGADLYGFVPGIGVLIAAVAVLGVPLGADLALLVPATALMLTFSAALALVLSALHVYFRDVRFVVQATLLAWFYATPVLYPLGLADGWVRRAIEVNPATGIVELFRAATTGAAESWLPALWWSLGWTTLLVVLAVVLYRRLDRVLVDLL